MKKRMFITTIVMMLVLAVALTTSSLAWFTSANATVTAQAATFTAKSNGTSTVSLKISDTPGSWSTQIGLTNANGRYMEGMIPTSPLIATAGSPLTTNTDWTGVYINSDVATMPTRAAFTWPSKMTFNSATIDDESHFVIEKSAAGKLANGDDASASVKNGVTDYQGLAKDLENGAYYYDEFYIHNADTQSTINSLTFKLKGSLTTIASTDATNYNAGDYTCNAYGAFILFDAVKCPINSVVPASAIRDAGKNVIAGASSGNDIHADQTNGTNDDTSDDYYLAWVPFAGFTIGMDKTGASGMYNQNVAWQFADLDAGNGTSFTYNNAGIASLPTQATDAVSGDTGFALNEDSYKALNNKVSLDGASVSTQSRDTTSQFSMPAQETYLVAFYFWLDGYSMTAFTDTTVANVGITIDAAQ